MADTQKEKFPLLAKVVNGGLAGVISVTTLFPLDLVKTRLQIQRIKPNCTQMYNSMWDCFKKTYKSEGFRGMYRGSGVNVLLITPEKAIKLIVNDYCRHYLSQEHKLTLKFEILSGAIAGMCQVIITTPMELLKVQLQNAGQLAILQKVDRKAAPKFEATHIALKLLRTEGISGLYRGLGITMVRDISFSVLYFPVFAHLNAFGPKKHSAPDKAVFWFTFLAGCASGSIAALCATPFDVIKTRLQLLVAVDSEMKYSGIVDAAVKILRTEGPFAFFKGGATRVLVIAPAFGIVEMVYFLGVGEYILGVKK
ncbi:mitochondrial glutamate carrier 1-like [Schistocerca piceifrons]|uniref:mitochondrial glutamate carrier 1-like n=1 Tax=Schistocerca piceifrons TaxID=274613 RepID=UPI001F5E4906|nr:mitochondrial glutamate carrier 1-like [Schistocerca piceifrons]